MKAVISVTLAASITRFLISSCGIASFSSANARSSATVSPMNCPDYRAEYARKESKYSHPGLQCGIRHEAKRYLHSRQHYEKSRADTHSDYFSDSEFLIHNFLLHDKTILSATEPSFIYASATETASIIYYSAKYYKISVLSVLTDSISFKLVLDSGFQSFIFGGTRHDYGDCDHI